MDAAESKLICREKVTDATASLFADSVEVPERFIRTNEIQAAVVVVGEDEAHELPVIDMAKLLDPKSSALETAKLGSACRNWGFFQVTNHGADEAAIQRMKESTVQFFSLPLEAKNAIAFRGENVYEGFGHHFSGPASAGKLDWAECVLLTTQPIHARNMELWPTSPPTFRHALDRYSMEMMNLARRLLGFMATDLGVSREALLGAFFGGDAAGGKGQSMSFHHYPPCRHPDKVMGIAPHTDLFGLTLLLHVDDTPGLQIKKDGRWFPVRPLPGAFVVNVGVALVVLTNGAYRSVEHRVVPSAEKSRATIATFQDACVEGMVRPLPELLNGGEAQARYKSIEKLEYRKGNVKALDEGTRFLDSLKL
ncbi:hypothetical protein ACP70R_000136 [Stipagrostis hirtigluma subsp. patula]